ncbi:MAG: hypothetical protein P8L39_17025 [Halioglobus sp.]|nr:hypothetical protein [Halioglobus sp.]
MNELRRMAYLEALGVDSYVSRVQLPGAAATRRLAIAAVPNRQQPDVNAGLKPLDTEDVLIQVRPDAAAPTKSGTVVTLDTAQPSKHADSVPKFSLTAIVAGDWLWLEELSGPLTTEQVRLVHSMAQALLLHQQALGHGTVSAVQPEVAQFDWPIHTNQQLDLGAEAARASVAGFVDRRLGQYDCRGLVLLGQDCTQRIAGQHNSVTTVSTLSSAEILVKPALKRQVWRDLLALVSAS